MLGDIRHALHLLLGKRRVFGSALHLDEFSRPGHDEIHIDIGFAVFLVAQVQENLAAHDTDTHRRHGIFNRIDAENAVCEPLARCLGQCHISAGDRRRARAAVGLNDIAIDPDRFFAQAPQIGLSEGFFHADPHPGNMIWRDDKIYFIDFGMVGELDAGLRDSLLMLVMALWQEDQQFAAEAILALAEQDDDTGSSGINEAFVADLGKIMEKHRNLSLKEIELGPLLTELTAVALKHDVRLPASMALTAKALAQMQLAAAELDPTLDPFAVAGQYMFRHILGKVRARVAPGKMLYEMSKVQARMGRIFLALENLMGAAKGGRLQVQFRGTERLEDSIRSAGRRLALSFGAAATIGGAAIASTADGVPTWLPVAGVSVGAGLVFGLIVDLVRKR